MNDMLTYENLSFTTHAIIVLFYLHIVQRT